MAAELWAFPVSLPSQSFLGTMWRVEINSAWRVPVMRYESGNWPAGASRPVALGIGRARGAGADIYRSPDISRL